MASSVGRKRTHEDEKVLQAPVKTIETDWGTCWDSSSWCVGPRQAVVLHIDLPYSQRFMRESLDRVKRSSRIERIHWTFFGY